jgi:hypothetical protein
MFRAFYTFESGSSPFREAATLRRWITKFRSDGKRLPLGAAMLTLPRIDCIGRIARAAHQHYL